MTPGHLGRAASAARSFASRSASKSAAVGTTAGTNGFSQWVPVQWGSPFGPTRQRQTRSAWWQCVAWLGQPTASPWAHRGADGLPRAPPELAPLRDAWARLSQWSFDCGEYAGEELQGLALAMAHDLGLGARFLLPSAGLARFVALAPRLL